MNDACLVRHDVQVVYEGDDVPSIMTDRHKLLQILVNLINNAEHATENSLRDEKVITVTACVDGEELCIRVSDNGIGIHAENLSKIFTHGFTTKKTGHGFGLHSSALAARQLNDSLTVHSDGLNQGATFTLRLPLSKATLCS
jgi:signal transduction histidine kinase